MTYATKHTGTWAELPFSQDVTSGTGDAAVTASYATVMAWSVAEQERFGVYEVPEPAAPPAGKVGASRVLGGTDRPAWVVTYADAPVPRPPPVPASISDRQFAQQLALDGTIRQDEALAWAARGDLPDAMEAALARIPEAGDQRFGARMLLSSATTYERAHPLVPTLGALLTNPATNAPYDTAALDALWRNASNL